MPTYEYECTKCGEKFELYQPITDSAKKFIKTDCKECNNKAPVTRLLGTGGGIIFKGSGFYQTDYRSESYKKAAEADKPSSETKTAKESTDKTSTPKSTDSKETKVKPKKSGKGDESA